MTTFDILTNPLRADHPFGKYYSYARFPYFFLAYISKN